MGNVKKMGNVFTKPEIVNKKHKNDTITSKKGTFRAFFNLVKIRQKNYLKKNHRWILGKNFENFWKNGKRNTPFHQNFQKNSKSDTPFFQKSLKKG